ncbi:hypothetical protein CARUB_v10018562mg [Capsella rubella]|uniref:Receptor-like serine/threonine-protein kinase n=1 Tax=Capsella rubella TaxID=81985 RepID=R0FRL5_9BRAS|nr:hypothetical protein CARUB_v10018562mg [Capsella rubella]
MMYLAFSLMLSVLLKSTTSEIFQSNHFLSPTTIRTIVSPGQIFELGFFTGDGAHWYLRIWYKDVPKKDYVWVANRDNALSDPVGSLKITDSNLDIRDQFDKLIWSTNLPRRKTNDPVVAELLDNGNLVLRCNRRNSSNHLLWQSFDFPTDTLLPEMKLGWTKRSGKNKILRSWASDRDPSSGSFTYEIETVGGALPQRVIKEGGRTLVSRVDSWNGIGSVGLPATHVTGKIQFDFIMTDEEISYSFRLTTKNLHSKLQMTHTGRLERVARSPREDEWVAYWITPTDRCDEYSACGPYGLCNINTSPICSCIQGFSQRNKEAWTGMNFKDGCVRNTPLNINSDGFHHLNKMKLPDSKAVTVEKGLEFKACKKKCVKDYNCTAFACVDMWNGAGLTCLIWSGELFDSRIFSSHGQDLHVRLAKTDLEVIPSRRYLSPLDNEDLLARMDFKTIAYATRDFSTVLGQGGFGFVYKGTLQDGTLVAVKRLSDMSVQGTTEFKTEVELIAKLQHINLVRLLGFCDDNGEKILIYEYLENQSLDVYIFGNTTESRKLNWQQRFAIAKGIAQGIQYIHQESRFRIIHRDIKASNVLLDRDMIPKISDFGLARITRNETDQDNTRRVVGSFGYMAPEYQTNGSFSVKSDVFSFGVLLLEIICGKRNRGFSNLEGDTSLLSCVWRNWEEEDWLKTVDPLVVDQLSSSSSPSTSQEVHRCLQIGLLCVQEHAADRPLMSYVVMMLGSEAPVPQPKPSGYCFHCVGKRSLESGSSSSTQPTQDSWTVNQITASVIDPR